MAPTKPTASGQVAATKKQSATAKKGGDIRKRTAGKVSKGGKTAIPAATSPTLGGGGNPFWQTKFTEIERFPAVAPPADLNNAVHPLFARSNFTDPLLDWVLVQMSAMLATRFLETEALQPLFYTMLNFHPARQVEGLSKSRQTVSKDNDGYEVWQYDVADDVRDLKLTREQKKLVDTGLTALAGLIDFVGDPAIKIHGDTKANNRKPTYAHFLPSGLGSTIRYSEGQYQKLVNAHRQGDWPLLRVLQFELATTLVHEVGHALLIAREGEEEWEPFFGKSQVAEVGFEIESRLFGGLIDNFWRTSEPPIQLHQVDIAGQAAKSELRGLMVKWEWPYGEMIENYKRNDLSMYSRGALPTEDLAWRTRLNYFTEKFTNDFWAPISDDEADRSKLMYPEKEVGYCFSKNNPRKPTASMENRLNGKGHMVVKEPGNIFVVRRRP